MPSGNKHGESPTSRYNIGNDYIRPMLTSQLMRRVSGELTSKQPLRQLITLEIFLRNGKWEQSVHHHHTTSLTEWVRPSDEVILFIKSLLLTDWFCFVRICMFLYKWNSICHHSILWNNLTFCQKIIKFQGFKI